MIIVLHNPNGDIDDFIDGPIDLGGCVPVAALETDSLDEAVTMTQVTAEPWINQPGLIPLPAAWGGARSTSAGDVLIDANSSAWRYTASGFTRLGSQHTTPMTDRVIITRHRGLVSWLAARGISGQVIDQAEQGDVAGRHVVGNLPLHLAALAESVTTVEMPGFTREQRGQDLSPTEMDTAGAVLRCYVIRQKAIR